MQIYPRSETMGVTVYPPTDDPRYLKDSSVGYRLELEVPSSVLLCTFAGVWLRDATPGFQFVHATSDLSVQRAFFTDIDQLLYQKGVRGLGNNVMGVADALRGIHEKSGAEHIIYTGNSMGGFAAILFGVLAGADDVQVFSPQTELQHPSASRFPENVERAMASTATPYLSLQALIDETPVDERPQITIHYSAFNLRDHRHANALAGRPRVRIHRYPMMNHSLASALRDTGLLSTILREACDRIPMSERTPFLLDKTRVAKHEVGKVGRFVRSRIAAVMQ
jgi:hypothetical protein